MKRKLTDKQRLAIGNRYSQGETTKELSREFDCSYQTIQRACHQYNVVMRPPGLGEGRSTTHKSGYVMVWISDDDPFSSMTWDKHRYVPEHRLVMARHLGRPLLPWPQEQVHHINGDRMDNRIDNLQLTFGNHGSGVNAQCCDCGSMNIEFVGRK